MDPRINATLVRLRTAPTTHRLVVVLTRLVGDRRQHARFMNTLARLEYVGVRKMLKSRRAERLDLDGLSHMLDEIVHALRLKKAAIALAGEERAWVATFSPTHTLAGDAGEDYFQSLDHAAAAALADVDAALRAEANYLLTSLAIEIRAQVFYPIYERCLQEAKAPFSVAPILRDEDRHLDEMSQRLDALLPDWRGRFDAVDAREDGLFAGFLSAVEAELNLPAAHGESSARLAV